MVFDSLIAFIIRTRFRFTGREKACVQIEARRAFYLDLASKLKPEQASLPIRVPRMVGVQEEMRNWSFYMLLEHNAIVNRSITSITQSLAEGKEPTGHGAIDPKKDVLPSPNPGIEQIEAFNASIDDHLKTVSILSRLKGSKTKPHPIFGPFDAHCWHCMFAFHLQVHAKQAKRIFEECISDGHRSP